MYEVLHVNIVTFKGTDGKPVEMNKVAVEDEFGNLCELYTTKDVRVGQKVILGIRNKNNTIKVYIMEIAE